VYWKPERNWVNRRKGKPAIAILIKIFSRSFRKFELFDKPNNKINSISKLEKRENFFFQRITY
jgi:hypothetical protein